MRPIFTVTDGDYSTVNGPTTLGMAVVTDIQVPYTPVILQSLIIFEQYRGKGHGTSLLKMLIQHAKNECKTLMVPTETLDADYPGAFVWLSDRGFTYVPIMNALVKRWY